MDSTNQLWTFSLFQVKKETINAALSLCHNTFIMLVQYQFMLAELAVFYKSLSWGSAAENMNWQEVSVQETRTRQLAAANVTTWKESLNAYYHLKSLFC